jgi:hypothetical protein
MYHKTMPCCCAASENIKAHPPGFTLPHFQTTMWHYPTGAEMLPPPRARPRASHVCSAMWLCCTSARRSCLCCYQTSNRGSALRAQRYPRLPPFHVCAASSLCSRSSRRSSLYIQTRHIELPQYPTDSPSSPPPCLCCLAFLLQRLDYTLEVCVALSDFPGPLLAH